MLARSNYNELSLAILILVTCDPLSTIENGNLTLTTDGIRTVVSIQCDIGSSVNGSVSVECNELGTWTETVPTCGKIFFCT